MKKSNGSGFRFLKSCIIVLLILGILAITAGSSVYGMQDVVRQKGASASLTGLKAAGSKPEKGFEIHFIDVGQGDAILVLCDGHAMLVDGGQSKESDTIYTYLRNNDIDHLDIIVASHADADHIGGLSGALNFAKADLALSPVVEDETETFQDFKKYLAKQGLKITVPRAGDEYSVGSASVKILGPTEITGEDNNNSLVLKVVHGKYSFLLTGDAEEDEEQKIIRSGADLQCTVLKVAHHGSKSSSSQSWLKACDPAGAVISCGKGNEYGHPTEEVLSRLRDLGASVFRTDLQGDIIFKEKDGDLLYSVEHETDQDLYAPGVVPVPEQPDPVTRTNVNADNENKGNNAVHDYILNTNTKKFHYPDCKSVKRMKEKNKQDFSGTREEAMSMGYDPCGNCNP